MIQAFSYTTITLMVILFLGVSTPAHAGFFSDLFKVIGTGHSVSASAVDGASQTNSQTMPLLESSVNPDTAGVNTIKEAQILVIDDSDALLPVASPMGPAVDIARYASNAKISTYTVKKGDTISSIAKKYKTTEAAITYSNADLQKSDLLKVGQKLVIVPLKPQAEKILAKNDTTPAQSTDKMVKKDKVVVPVIAPDVDTEGPSISIDTDLPSPSAKQQQAPVVSASAPVTPVVESGPSGQPSGTITGGYIWPFPAGVGRVSQGLHADQAYDFAAPTGTPIYAVQAGSVLIARPTGYNGGYGKYVVINFNDGRQAIFGHMSKLAVEEGDVVAVGDVIGYVGSTGKSTGPHVHIGFHGSIGNPYAGLKVNSTELSSND
jgi:murein DD-endopeptidase MepM/ murein hydrolase activator NlpD